MRWDEQVDMSMFGPKMGSWFVHSESDSRWNKSGRAEGLCCTGGPQENVPRMRGDEPMYGDPPTDVISSCKK
jgi:hypothetical protein